MAYYRLLNRLDLAPHQPMRAAIRFLNAALHDPFCRHDAVKTIFNLTAVSLFTTASVSLLNRVMDSRHPDLSIGAARDVTVGIVTGLFTLALATREIGVKILNDKHIAYISKKHGQLGPWL